MRNFLMVTTLLLIVTSCNKDKARAGYDVEIYLLSSYQLVSGKCQVDSSLAVLESSPLIGNSEIMQYFRASFRYQLTGSALEKVKLLIGRTPFAVTVNRKVIFYGFYMPPYLSSTCSNSITMAENLNQNGSITMSLGYPGSLSGVGIVDRRNDATLLATLANQGKLR